MDFMTFYRRSRFGGVIRSFVSVGRIWRQKNGRKSELWRQARWGQGHQGDRTVISAGPWLSKTASTTQTQTQAHLRALFQTQTWSQKTQILIQIRAQNFWGTQRIHQTLFTPLGAKILIIHRMDKTSKTTQFWQRIVTRPTMKHKASFERQCPYLSSGTLGFEIWV